MYIYIFQFESNVIGLYCLFICPANQKNYWKNFHTHRVSFTGMGFCVPLVFYIINRSTRTTLLAFDSALACCESKNCQNPPKSVDRCIIHHWGCYPMLFQHMYYHQYFLKICGTYYPNGSERVKRDMIIDTVKYHLRFHGLLMYTA